MTRGEAAADVELARRPVTDSCQEEHSLAFTTGAEVHACKGKQMDGLSDNMGHPSHSAPLY